MNRHERRSSHVLMRQRQSWVWVERELTDADRARYPAVRNMFRAFFNDLYSVQVYRVRTALGEVLHLIVRGQQNSREPPWRDLQRIKNELVSEDAYAVQAYPRQADVIDQADVYHLWVLPEELPFGLHRENGLAR